MNSKMILASFLAVCTLSTHANADPVKGNELKQLINGKRIYLAVPLGGEFPLYYKKGGKVDGSGEATGLGKTMKPNDSGRWWISGAKLCQKWQTWYDGKVFCFTIQKTADSKIAWVRDDGYSGTARIGN